MQFKNVDYKYLLQINELRREILQLEREQQKAKMWRNRWVLFRRIVGMR